MSENAKTKTRIDIFSQLDEDLEKAKSPDEQGFEDQFGKVKIRFVRTKDKTGRYFYSVLGEFRKGLFSFNLKKRVKNKMTTITAEEFTHLLLATGAKMQDDTASVFIDKGARLVKVRFIDSETGEVRDFTTFEVIIDSWYALNEDGEEVKKYTILSAPLTSGQRKLFNDLANLPADGQKRSDGIYYFIPKIYLRSNEEDIDLASLEEDIDY